jgi:PIN domain-containing protein
MDSAVRDCLVIEHGRLVDSLTLPDPDDRHVLAAAIQGDAEVIVTYNLADFPSQLLARYGIEAVHPDGFLVNLFDAAADDFCAAASLQRQSLKNPPKNVENFLTTLEAARLHQTVARLRTCAERL